jgi:hypothetical protein
MAQGLLNVNANYACVLLMASYQSGCHWKEGYSSLMLRPAERRNSLAICQGVAWTAVKTDNFRGWGMQSIRRCDYSSFDGTPDGASTRGMGDQEGTL